MTRITHLAQIKPRKPRRQRQKLMEIKVMAWAERHKCQICGGVKPDKTNSKTYGNQGHGLGRETQMSNIWRS